MALAEQKEDTSAIDERYYKSYYNGRKVLVLSKEAQNCLRENQNVCSTNRNASLVKSKQNFHKN